MLPVLLLAPYAGVLADRVDKRRLLDRRAGGDGRCSRSCSACSRRPGRCSSGTSSRSPALLGLATAFDNPTRQSFVGELVGAGRPAQRGQPELRDGERRPRGRAGRRRHPDRHGRHVGLLPPERRELRRRRSRRSRRSTVPRSRRPTPAPKGRGQLREGLRYVRPDARARDAARDDGADRHARLRVPGGAADRRAPDVPRRPADVRLHDRGDGRRRGRRRPRRRRQRPHRHARGGRRGRPRSASRSCSPRPRPT